MNRTTLTSLNFPSGEGRLVAFRLGWTSICTSAETRHQRWNTKFVITSYQTRLSLSCVSSLWIHPSTCAFRWIWECFLISWISGPGWCCGLPSRRGAKAVWHIVQGEWMKAWSHGWTKRIRKDQTASLIVSLGSGGLRAMWHAHQNRLLANACHTLHATRPPKRKPGPRKGEWG